MPLNSLVNPLSMKHMPEPYTAHVRTSDTLVKKSEKGNISLLIGKGLLLTCSGPTEARGATSDERGMDSKNPSAMSFFLNGL